MNTVSDLVESTSDSYVAAKAVRQWVRERMRSGIAKQQVWHSVNWELFLLRDDARADGDADLTLHVETVLFLLNEAIAQAFANRWRKGPESEDVFEEVLGASRVGLWEAVQHFDCKKSGGAFYSYAYLWMLKRGGNEAWRQHPVRMSRAAWEARQQVALEVGASGCSDVAVLSERLGLPERVVRGALKTARTEVSFDTPINDEGGVLGDVLDVGAAPSAEDTFLAEERVRFAREFIDGLEEPARSIVLLRFGFVDGRVWAQGDIASFLSVSSVLVGDVLKRLGD